MNNFIIEFLEYMEVEKGDSLLSVRNYHHYLTRFSHFAKESGVTSPEKIDLELTRQYRLWLNRLDSDKPLSKATQNYHLIALRTFLKYLGTKGINTLSPEKIELAKTGDRQISFLEIEELDHLLSQPNIKSIQGLRDKAILNLFFSTGLRVSELCNLKIDDINLDKSEFSVVGKGKKVRVVFLDHEAKEALHQYLLKREDKNPFLFVSYGHSLIPNNKQLETAEGMTPRSVQRMIRKYSKMAGLTKKVTPHVMRHSFATDLLMSGADLRAVQSLLGHKSVTTTQIYTHVTDQHLGEVHQAFHGLRRSKEDVDKKEQIS